MWVTGLTATLVGLYPPSPSLMFVRLPTDVEDTEVVEDVVELDVLDDPIPPNTKKATPPTSSNRMTTKTKIDGSLRRELPVSMDTLEVFSV